MKNDGTIIAVILILLIGGFLAYHFGAFSFIIAGGETMDRTAPTTAQPGSSINVVYTPHNVGGNWGATVIDTLACGSYSKTYQYVFLSPSNIAQTQLNGPSTTESIQIPSNATVCTLAGNYEYGTNPISNFNSLYITVAPLCKSGADTNGDGIIEMNELSVYIQGWANSGTITRTQLGEAIMEWANSCSGNN